MDHTQLLVQFEQWSHVLLEWIGFGTLVGLLAKAIMPGRDPGGAVVTLAMGIGGTILGLGTLAYFYDGPRVTPISPLGLVVATAGSFLLLLFYRLLRGRFFVEGELPVRRPVRVAATRPLRRRYDTAEYIDTEP